MGDVFDEFFGTIEKRICKLYQGNIMNSLRKYFMFLVMVSSLVFTGCNSDTPNNENNTTTQDTNDTNSTPETNGTDTEGADLRFDAIPISLNTEVTGNLEIATDVDYFTFTLSQKTTVEFERQSTTGTVGQANFANFEVLDENGASLLRDYMDKYEATKQSLTLDAGTYYIKISTSSSNVTGYRLILNGTEGDVTPDDYGNNSTHAHSIELNTEVTGNLEIATDVDYFTFTLSQKTTVEFERQSTTGTVGQANFANFEVLDENGASLLRDYMDKYEATKQSLTLDAGTYYIKISTSSNNSTGYRLILN